VIRVVKFPVPLSSVAGGSLTLRPKRSLRCLLVELLWQKKRQASTK